LVAHPGSEEQPGHLAKRAKVGISTVQEIEDADCRDRLPAGAGGVEQTRDYREAARAASIEAVCKALVAAGVTFLSDDGKAGVGVRGRIKAK
jgi:hypothetical protein